MVGSTEKNIDYRKDLDAAAAGLAEASRLLSASIMTEPTEVIEMYFAFVRGAKAKAAGALLAYNDHLKELSLVA
jgi:hypothetical protein